MACRLCGAPCTGDRCSQCVLIETCEKTHGDSVAAPDDGGWQVEQAGLDGDATGQTTLDGGVVKEVRADD